CVRARRPSRIDPEGSDRIYARAGAPGQRPGRGEAPVGNRGGHDRRHPRRTDAAARHRHLFPGEAVSRDLSGWFRALVASCGLTVLALPGCSIKRLAINRLGDALAESGATYASDNDPQLVRDALPFALKLVESPVEQSPRHRGLLLAAAGGFTQYAFAFVEQDADETQDHDVAASAALR